MEILALLIIGLGLSLLALRRDSARAEFVKLRTENYTQTLLRLARRAAGFLLVGAVPTMLFLLAVQLMGPQSYPATQLIQVGVVLAFLCGWILAGIAYPVLLGFLAPPGTPQTQLGRVSHALLSMLFEATPVTHIADTGYTWVRGRLPSWRRLPRVKRAIITALVLFFCGVPVLIIAFLPFLLIILLDFSIYFYAVVLYALPVYVPLRYSADGLEKLNEKPFLIALGLAVVAGADLLAMLRERVARAEHPVRANFALTLTEGSIVLAVALTSSNEYPAHRLSPTHGALDGAAVGAVLILIIDLGQAYAATQIASRRTTAPLRADMGLIRAGARARKWFKHPLTPSQRRKARILAQWLWQDLSGKTRRPHVLTIAVTGENELTATFNDGGPPAILGIPDDLPQFHPKARRLQAVRDDPGLFARVTINARQPTTICWPNGAELDLSRQRLQQQRRTTVANTLDA